jgi:SAM-dependent methyltransferase
LAQSALRRIASSSPAAPICRWRATRPVDYMRWAEFEATLSKLHLRPGMRVLDISSPQWLTLFLASRYADTQFVYTNIIDSELQPFEEIGGALGLPNLSFRKEDVRRLSFAEGEFDVVISVSVPEHIYPEQGGDEAALQEICRAWQPGGELPLTVLGKEKPNIVYIDGPVYERPEGQRSFCAREYDLAMFCRLVKTSWVGTHAIDFICERAGCFAIDYHEWGPGRGRLSTKFLRLIRALGVGLFRTDLDGALARRYLTVGPAIEARVVNLSAVLRKVA